MCHAEFGVGGDRVGAAFQQHWFSTSCALGAAMGIPSTMLPLNPTAADLDAIALAVVEEQAQVWVWAGASRRVPALCRPAGRSARLPSAPPPLLASSARS